MTDKTEIVVTQADREAAKTLLGRDDAGPSWWSIDSGNADNDPMVQAFARHRHEATAKLQADLAEALEALEAIRDMGARPYDGPEFDRLAVAECEDCQRYAGHPIQRGICDLHRKPLYARADHSKFEERSLGYRCQSLARDFLAKHDKEAGDA